MFKIICHGSGEQENLWTENVTLGENLRRMNLQT